MDEEQDNGETEDEEDGDGFTPMGKVLHSITEYDGFNGLAKKFQRHGITLEMMEDDGRDVIVSIVQAADSGHYIAMIAWKECNDTFVEKTAYVLSGNPKDDREASQEALRSMRRLGEPLYPEYTLADVSPLTDGDRSGIRWEPPLINVRECQ